MKADIKSLYKLRDDLKKKFSVVNDIIEDFEGQVSKLIIGKASRWGRKAGKKTRKKRKPLSAAAKAAMSKAAKERWAKRKAAGK